MDQPESDISTIVSGYFDSRLQEEFSFEKLHGQIKSRRENQIVRPAIMVAQEYVDGLRRAMEKTVAALKEDAAKLPPTASKAFLSQACDVLMNRLDGDVQRKGLSHICSIVNSSHGNTRLAAEVSGARQILTMNIGNLKARARREFEGMIELLKIQHQATLTEQSDAFRVAPENCLDVLVITADKVEYDAVLEVEAGASGGSNWEKFPVQTRLEASCRDFQTKEGGRLRIAVTRALDTGGIHAASAAAPLVVRFKPRCIAMVGVCAGRRGEVELGDVIIADRLWNYEAGKLLAEVDDSGRRLERVQGDVNTYRLRPAWWKQRAESFQPPVDSAWLKMRPLPYEVQMDWVLERLSAGEDPLQHPERKVRCPQWPKVLKLLWEKRWLQDDVLDLTREGKKHISAQKIKYPDGLPTPAPFRVHVGPIGTGSKVVDDSEVFERLSNTMRKVLGLDMEAVAIGQVAEEHPTPHMIVVKGVMDFAFKKDNHFKLFAARAAAECLIAFLRENLQPNMSTQSEGSGQVFEHGA